MKKIILVVGMLIASLQLFAQGNTMTGQANMGHLYGKVIDSMGKPIADASVVLLQSRMDTVTKKTKDILLQSSITGKNGEFSLEELPVFGNFKLKISATGYQALEQAT